MFGDTPYSKLYKSALVSQVCMDHCDSYKNCLKNKSTLLNCPKLTLQTFYVCKYLSCMTEQSGVIYPYKGTWLDQPEWVTLAFTIALNKLYLMQNNKLKEATKKK